MTFVYFSIIDETKDQNCKKEYIKSWSLKWKDKKEKQMIRKTKEY